MQDSGYGYPPAEDRRQGLPLLLCALAAANQNVSPEPIDALSEGAQLIDIPGNSMVLVVASDHLPKPCTDLTDTIMLPAEKPNLDGLQLRNHSLFRRNPDSRRVWPGEEHVKAERSEFTLSLDGGRAGDIEAHSGKENDERTFVISRVIMRYRVNTVARPVWFGDQLLSRHWPTLTSLAQRPLTTRFPDTTSTPF
jgi:hypothetical protein